MSLVISALTAILTPVLGKIANHFISKRLKPVVDAVKAVELDKGIINLIPVKERNEHKHREILIFIKTTPVLSKFVRDCGWSNIDLDWIVKFCVLIAKKPPTSEENRDKWNDNDKQTVFNFLLIIGKRWISQFGGK